MPPSRTEQARAHAPQLATLLSALPADPAACVERLQRIHRVEGDGALQRLFVDAGYHGVSGVIDPVIVQATHLPAAVREQASRRLAVEELWQAHVWDALTAAARVLGRAGVEACALKGPLLGMRLYAPSAMRHSMDIDLLVAGGSFDRAVHALESAGYLREQSGVTMDYLRRFSHHLGFSRPGAPPLELHFRSYAGFGVNLDSDFLLGRATPVPVGADTHLLAPAPDDEFVYLAAHAAGHSFCRLVWLYDLKLLLRKAPIDFDNVAARARSAGVLHAVAYAVRLLAEWFDEDVPTDGPFALQGPRAAVADRLLAAVSRPQVRSVRENLEGLIFTSMLCDEPSATVWLLQHHLGRVVKRRLKQMGPGLLPEHWAS